MENHRKPIEDESWRQYFHRHFSDLEEKYPSLRKSRRGRRFRFLFWVKSLFLKKERPLCPDCVFDEGSVCFRQERPYAIECRDFKEKSEERRKR